MQLFNANLVLNSVHFGQGQALHGLTLVPWAKGKSLLWDYTCADTFAKSYVDRTSRDRGYAAKQAEDKKFDHYSHLMDQFVFVPIASETSGVIGKVGLQLLKQIGSKIKQVTHERRATSYLIQRISVAIQRGNVASIIGTLPPSKNLDAKCTFEKDGSTRNYFYCVKQCTSYYKMDMGKCDNGLTCCFDASNVPHAPMFR